ncbi:peptidase inhibitor family I36 protein [Saccharothrix australiensis]|uniref:Peptidase inhibitor family I36 n=1 Tax=Saccharothrix australiensis TaxID=2072 RepID=A0A495VR68_9PSEU|nr:peptidase inhibitor family I36 protein [Saccharothrix australiensis]RKT51754.1 peptidase inhibitor family I36 [Saccharothrix australiensis]
MALTKLRLALVVPVVALAAVLVPVAHAQAAPVVAAPVAAAEPVPPSPVITRCDKGNACAWTKPKGLGKGWQVHESQPGCYNVTDNNKLGAPARSVYNNTRKAVTYFRNNNCTGRNFTLQPGQWSDFAGGQPMDSQVWSFRVPR